jgi:hypothetical protein
MGKKELSTFKTCTTICSFSFTPESLVAEVTLPSILINPMSTLESLSYWTASFPHQWLSVSCSRKLLPLLHDLAIPWPLLQDTQSPPGLTPVAAPIPWLMLLASLCCQVWVIRDGCGVVFIFVAPEPSAVVGTWSALTISVSEKHKKTKNVLHTCPPLVICLCSDTETHRALHFVLPFLEVCIKLHTYFTEPDRIWSPSIQRSKWFPRHVNS